MNPFSSVMDRLTFDMTVPGQLFLFLALTLGKEVFDRSPTEYDDDVQEVARRFRDPTYGLVDLAIKQYPEFR